MVADDFEELEPGELDTDHVMVRTLTPDDFSAVVAIDEAATGLRRLGFYRTRLKRSMEDSSIHLSLAAELDGMLVGFMMVTFYAGEFGQPEPVAVLDALGVHPEYRGRAVGRALLRQLEMNLTALRVEVLRTEVDWDQQELVGFMAGAGFKPSTRLSLEKRLR